MNIWDNWKTLKYLNMNDSFHLKEGERILNDVTSRVIGPDVTALLACMCIFFLESRRQHLLWALESVWHFRDTRVYAFHYAELGIYQFKNKQLEFRTPPGSKTYKRLFRRRESIDTITPDSSFHQNFILSLLYKAIKKIHISILYHF